MIEEEVIKRFITHYGKPDRKEEKMIREISHWSVQEYLASECHKRIEEEARFMSDFDNSDKPIWWVKMFKTTFQLISMALIIEIFYRIIKYLL